MNTYSPGSIRLILALLLAGPFMIPGGNAIAQDGLSLDERVACQAAIGDIAWNETLWPDTNPEPKPARSTILSDADIRARVEEQLRMEAALAADYGIRISDAMLQTELNRMARNTRAPDRLRERFEALGNDPQRIAECMARPNLVRKYLRSAYASDEREHGDLRQRAEAALAHLDDTATLSASGAHDQTTVLVRRGEDDAPEVATDHATGELKLDADAFEAEAARLADASEQPKLAGHPEPSAWPTLALRETDEGFVHEQVLSRADGRIEVRSLSWAKRPFEHWWNAQESRWPAAPTAAALASPLTLPRITGQTAEGVTAKAAADTWRAEAYPERRIEHTAVWTGTEMIVWGGTSSSHLATGSRYNPTDDSWSAMSLVNAPAARYQHTAVWTGTEMIVWGGYGDAFLGTGGRYNPAADSWTAMSTMSAPAARYQHKAVWTGTEMIVWGGFNGSNLATGGRYDPASDSWMETSTTGAPDARRLHSAVWTGAEMIIWGGVGGSNPASGGRYDPSADSWTATSNTGAPAARALHTAVWTGTEMIVWGGSSSGSRVATGGRYNPAANSWTATSNSGVPAAREHHTAVWTGTEMIIWGGYGDSFLASGARYRPSTNSWTATSASGTPTARNRHTAVWTGTEMIVWGGSSGVHLATGGRYNPSANSWTATSSTGAPAGRTDHAAVWTGTEMIVWAGYDGSYSASGGRYDPSTDSWTATSSAGAPAARSQPTAVWTGTEMIVWGGGSGGWLGTGGRYKPSANSWTATSNAGAPAARKEHTAIWTGTEMIIWGGYAGVTNGLASGGRYNPASNNWTAMSDAFAISSRYDHTAVWTGTEMIVWGGFNGSIGRLASGGRYSPSTDYWATTSSSGAPAARTNHTALWTGSEMIVWGGNSGSGPIATGSRYDPLADSWTATSSAGSPAEHRDHTAVWTGTEMIVWGGIGSSNLLATGSRYDPLADNWTATSTSGAPVMRQGHTAVWTGTEMIVWGGSVGSTYHDSMGVYYPYTTIQTSTTTVHALTPSPSIVNEPVEVTIRVVGATSAPTDGAVSVTASSGETCTSIAPTPVDAVTAQFSCELVFTAMGARTIAAEFASSTTHSGSVSTSVSHTVLGVVDITLSDLLPHYDGMRKEATVSTTPPGVTGVSLAYSQGGIPVAQPTDAGHYDITVSLNNPNYVLGTVTPDPAQLVIVPAIADITVIDLVQTWDGLPKPVTVITSPSALDLLVTYDGDVEAPSDVGTYTVEVVVIDEPNFSGAATATLQIVAGEAATLVKVAGDAQTSLAGTVLPQAPQVRVVDGGGNAVEGAVVSFVVTAGGGSVTGATATTDASGLAAVGSWTLGDAGGTNALTVNVPGSSVTPVTFTATATTQIDATVTVTSHNEFTRLGALHQHGVVVRNIGATLATGVAIEVPLPTEHNPASAIWHCQATGGASCPASTGTGAISITANLPAGAMLIFMTAAQVSAVPPDDLVQLTASVTAAGDIDPANDMASTSSVMVLFRNGFEPDGDGTHGEGALAAEVLGELRGDGPSLAATASGRGTRIGPSPWLSLETAQGRAVVIVDRLDHQGVTWIRVRDMSGPAHRADAWQVVRGGVGLALIQRGDSVHLLVDSGDATAEVPLAADATAGLLVLELGE